MVDSISLLFLLYGSFHQFMRIFYSFPFFFSLFLFLLPYSMLLFDFTQTPLMCSFVFLNIFQTLFTYLIGLLSCDTIVLYKKAIQLCHTGLLFLFLDYTRTGHATRDFPCAQINEKEQARCLYTLGIYGILWCSSFKRSKKRHYFFLLSTGRYAIKIGALLFFAPLAEERKTKVKAQVRHLPYLQASMREVCFLFILVK